MADTLLAYLIPRVVTQREPAATQALAYILNAAPDIAKAFLSVVSQTGFAPFELGRIAAEEQHGDSIPDLTIRDTAGAVRVLVENKFWAGLTDAQPVGYLDQLPSEAPVAILFVVPHTRQHSVWAELKDRCANKKVDLTDGTKTDDIAWSRSGNRILAITSWKYVLAQLQQAAYEGLSRSLLNFGWRTPGLLYEVIYVTPRQQPRRRAEPARPGHRPGAADRGSPGPAGSASPPPPARSPPSVESSGHHASA